VKRHDCNPSNKGANVVCVRFHDRDNLASCESFLLLAFPGEIKRNGGGLELTFSRGGLARTAEYKVVERLLWAWRTSHGIKTDDGIVAPTDS
jgi:hypothetical protein